MPVTVSYPGIYIQEAPSSSHTIVSAPTNVAVFIGYTHPLKTQPANFGLPVEIFGFSDYQRQFGGFVRSAAFAKAYDTNVNAKTGFGNTGAFGDMAVAVNQFFLNGGTDAFIVALQSSVVAALNPATVTISGFVLSAIEVTDPTYAMQVEVRPIAPPASAADPLADIKITYGPATTSAPTSPPSSPPASPVIASGAGVVVETYRRVSLVAALDTKGTPNPNYILNRLGTATSPISALVTAAAGAHPGNAWPAGVTTLTLPNFMTGNESVYSPTDYTNVMEDDTPLDKLPIFNLMVLPGVADNSVSGPSSGILVLSTALAFCEKKRAFLVMDPPVLDSADGSNSTNPIANSISTVPSGTNAALYFPYLLTPDPITGNSTNIVLNAPNEIPPAATVAGIYAATDLARGVWKAPAGFQATALNVTGVVQRGQMTDQRQGTLNPLGVNCLRDFPNVPTIVFGARTLVTQTDEQWRYVPVRRMALFLEQTFYANLKWVIFEPNAEPLWTAITMSINAFMLGLFKQGAFQGSTPSEAFSVQCNSQTTTQTDIDSGIVNIVVGFAPLKPAEFVVITIAQLAGQS